MPGMPARRPAPVVPPPPPPPPVTGAGATAGVAAPATGATPATPIVTAATAGTVAPATGAVTTGPTRRVRTRAVTTTSTTPRTHRPATPPAIRHYSLGTWLAAMVFVLLVAVVILGTVLFFVPRMIDSGRTTASAPVTSTSVVPAPAPPVRPAPFKPQFADVELAPPGLRREGCKEWYNQRGFSSREFWDEDSQTCAPKPR